MTEKSFMTAEEVAAELCVSKSKAYQIVTMKRISLLRRLPQMTKGLPSWRDFL